jgi:hypothetical protein
MVHRIAHCTLPELDDINIACSKHDVTIDERAIADIQYRSTYIYSTNENTCFDRYYYEGN